MKGAVNREFARRHGLGISGGECVALLGSQAESSGQGDEVGSRVDDDGFGDGPEMDAGEDAGGEEEGVDEEVDPRAAAENLLTQARRIFGEAPRYVELSCGHDDILTVNHHFQTEFPLKWPLPTRLGDMWYCSKCESRQMVWGVMFTETNSPDLKALRAMVRALNA